METTGHTGPVGYSDRHRGGASRSHFLEQRFLGAQLPERDYDAAQLLIDAVTHRGPP